MEKKMKNTDYIRATYKSSTIARLADFGYESEESINIDPDMNYALEMCKFLKKENQDTLFGIIRDRQECYYDYMDKLYPNGLFGGNNADNQMEIEREYKQQLMEIEMKLFFENIL